MTASSSPHRSRFPIGAIRPTPRTGGSAARCARWFRRRGCKSTDIDGLSLSSFTVGPDTAIGLTQHLGLSPRWLDHVPLGGASGVVALRRAARAVQCGDAEFVVCVAGDTNQVDSFRRMLSTFSRFAQDAVYPYGSGGPNASFALITRNYMKHYGATREDFGKICVAQRDNALQFPHALMKKPLTLDEYLGARAISDPIHLFDCVMPCAGAEAFLVCRDDVARSLGLKAARLLATIERHNAFPEDPIQYRGGWALDIDELYAMAGVGRGRRRFRADLRRLPGDLHDADRGSRLLRQGRGARLRPLAHADRRRQLPAQHLGRPALGRPGRRGRRLSRAWSRRCVS